MKEVHGARQFKEVVGSKFLNARYEQWVEAANRALKGKTISEYYHRTYDHITIKPLYIKDDLPAGFERMNPSLNKNNEWKIAQFVQAETLEELNKNLLEAIKYGQDTISFQLTNNMNETSLETILHNIDLDSLPFFIVSKEEIIPFYFMLANKMNVNTVSGFIGCDPIAVFLENGVSLDRMKTFYSLWKETILFVNQSLPNVKPIFVDGRIYEKTGGTAVQQLAFSLASAVEHIEQLKEKGMSIEDIFGKIVFGFSVGSDFFTEIAKLRAAKYLWNKIAEMYHVQNKKLPIFAETTMVNKSKLDPYTNMLRIGGEAFAAVVGGVQWLRVTPYDEVFHEISSLGTRLSYNIHHLLREEAKLSIVSDPSGGSYFIESLTRELIEKAWELFLKIEESGGMLQATKSGEIQKQVTQVRRKKQTDFYYRKIKLIGTNQYVDANEKLHVGNNCDNEQFSGHLLDDNLDKIKEMVQAGAMLKDFFNETIDQSISGENIDPLTPYRLSERYEELRYEISHYERNIGQKPEVILISCGDTKILKSRFEFVSEFLRGGGISTVFHEGNNFDKIIKETGKKLYCFCGSEQQLMEALAPIENIIQKYPDKEFIIYGVDNDEVQEKFEQCGIHLFIKEDKNQLVVLQKIVRFLVRGDHA
ncbi:methylmalonyl-CoA mutase family protein [Bacillus andreraoultii]|uniref:methylmalonyl-CoA mutase family protein n=1 Tax=Bacillus andreraoultii TaxID=1499685 RepID=UPI00053966E9|nr:methylmalonyl-CoA mutase family protein [Bacillus andreraoultii]